MLPEQNEQPEPILTPQGRRGLIIVLLISAVITIFLIFPISTVNAPEWLLTLQDQSRTFAGLVAPYFVVGALGATVALAELVATFRTYPRQALGTRWAFILMGVNVIASIIALLIARVTFPDAEPLLLVLGVGVGFQSIIRTRFILAKPVGKETGEEVSINLGWIYDQFQNLCRTQIDLELMRRRRQAVIQLMEYYSLRKLYEIARYTVIARATLTPEEERRQLEELEKLIDPQAPDRFARTALSLKILENGGPAYVTLLLTQAQGDGPVQAMAENEQMDEGKMVWRLVENYSLDQLVAMTNRLSDMEKVRQYVRRAAQPTPDTDVATQKTAIARAMIKNIGLGPLQEAIQESPPPDAPPPPETAEPPAVMETAEDDAAG